MVRWVSDVDDRPSSFAIRRVTCWRPSFSVGRDDAKGFGPTVLSASSTARGSRRVLAGFWLDSSRAPSATQAHPIRAPVEDNSDSAGAGAGFHS
jgi:hypothetical protein